MAYQSRSAYPAQMPGFQPPPPQLQQQQHQQPQQQQQQQQPQFNSYGQPGLPISPPPTFGNPNGTPAPESMQQSHQSGPPPGHDMVCHRRIAFDSFQPSGFVLVPISQSANQIDSCFSRSLQNSTVMLFRISVLRTNK